MQFFNAGKFRSITIAAALLVWSPLGAAEFPPADHGGADLILADGDVIWGDHINVGTFQIPAGATVVVKSYDGADADTGRAEILAFNFDIDGTLSALGAGYTGGGGGGANLGTAGSGSFPGFDGTVYGQSILPCGSSSMVSSLAGSGGDGAGPGGQPGGEGGKLQTNFTCTGQTVSSPPEAGEHGRYGAGAGPNNDTTTDESLMMGSGGSGAGATISPGVGGGAGGNGGGIIRLVPGNALHLGATGVISANGAWGNLRSGADGGDALPIVETYPGPDPELAQIGGAGSGGGICIDIRGLTTPDDATFDSGARITSLGAQGGPDATSGGTIKLLCATAPATLGNATLEAGRIAAPGFTLPSAVATCWAEYQ